MRRLSAKKRRGFLRYLESELYTKRKGLAPVARAIISTIEGKKVIQAVTPAQLTYLRTELDAFLAIEAFRQDKTRMTAATLSAYVDLKENKRAEKIRKDRMRALDGKTKSAVQEELGLEESYFLTLIPSSPAHIASMLRINELNDRLYLATKFRLACHLASHKMIFNSAQDLPLLPAALQILETTPRLKDDPIVGLYARAYRTLTFDDPVDRQQLVQYLDDNPETIANYEALDVFHSLLNDTIRKINTGSDSANQLAFYLLRSGMESGLLVKDGRMSGSIFFNITMISIKVNHLDWAESIHKSYRDSLSPSDYMTYYYYSRATLLMAKGQMEKAQDNLRKFDHQVASVHIQLQARILEVRLDFELNQRELLTSHLNSLSVFLSRHKELGYHRDISLNFVRLCWRLQQLPPHPSEEQREAMIALIVNFHVPSLRDWMLTQVPGKKTVQPSQRKTGQ